MTLKAWQTLIAAAVAGIGIFFAVKNVSRQIRINILLREEDRIDRQLPGLRNAVNFLEPFLIFRSVTGFHGTIGEFDRLGVGKAGSTFEKDIEKALPATDDATRAKVFECLFAAYRLAGTAEQSRILKAQMELTMGDPAGWVPSELKKLRAEIVGATMIFVRQRAEFTDQMDRVAEQIEAINHRIGQYERRRRRIRSEIENYFGD